MHDTPDRIYLGMLDSKAKSEPHSNSQIVWRTFKGMTEFVVFIKEQLILPRLITLWIPHKPSTISVKQATIGTVFSEKYFSSHMRQVMEW